MIIISYIQIKKTNKLFKLLTIFHKHYKVIYFNFNYKYNE